MTKTARFAQSLVSAGVRAGVSVPVTYGATSALVGTPRTKKQKRQMVNRIMIGAGAAAGVPAAIDLLELASKRVMKISDVEISDIFIAYRTKTAEGGRFPWLRFGAGVGAATAIGKAWGERSAHKRSGPEGAVTRTIDTGRGVSTGGALALGGVGVVGTYLASRRLPGLGKRIQSTVSGLSKGALSKRSLKDLVRTMQRHNRDRDRISRALGTMMSSKGVKVGEAPVRHDSWSAVIKEAVVRGGEEPNVPKKVVEVADAIRRDDPGASDEKAYRIAWATRHGTRRDMKPGTRKEIQAKIPKDEKERMKAAEMVQVLTNRHGMVGLRAGLFKESAGLGEAMQVIRKAYQKLAAAIIDPLTAATMRGKLAEASDMVMRGESERALRAAEGVLMGIR